MSRFSASLSDTSLLITRPVLPSPALPIVESHPPAAAGGGGSVPSGEGSLGGAGAGMVDLPFARVESVVTAVRLLSRCGISKLDLSMLGRVVSPLRRWDRGLDVFGTCNEFDVASSGPLVFSLTVAFSSVLAPLGICCDMADVPLALLVTELENAEARLARCEIVLSALESSSAGSSSLRTARIDAIRAGGCGDGVGVEDMCLLLTPVGLLVGIELTVAGEAGVRVGFEALRPCRNLPSRCCFEGVDSGVLSARGECESARMAPRRPLNHGIVSTSVRLLAATKATSCSAPVTSWFARFTRRKEQRGDPRQITTSSVKVSAPLFVDQPARVGSKLVECISRRAHPRMLHCGEPFQTQHQCSLGTIQPRRNIYNIPVSLSGSWWIGKSVELLGESELSLNSGRDLVSRLGISHVPARNKRDGVSAACGYRR